MASRSIFLSALLATTTLVALISAPREAQAFEVKHTAGGQLVHWHRASVSWTVDSSVRRVPGGEDAVSAAADAWTQLAGAPSLAVAGVGAKLSPGLDGTNAVFFVEGGFAPAGNALAVTILSFDDRTGEVLDADIVLNGKYQLGLVAKGTTHPTAITDPGGETYDIGRVLAHEMGHALALSDEPADVSALMYPYVSRAVSLATAPSDDDVAGLNALYTSVDPARVSATTSPVSSAAGCAVVAAPRSPRAPATLYVAAGLAIAALALARGARAARVRRGPAACTAFAAAALFVLPSVGAPAASPRSDFAASFEAKATVTKVSTTSVAGLFRSEVEVATTSCSAKGCPPTARFVTWGGTIDHVRQEIGGIQVPAAGEAVTLVLDPVMIHSMTRLPN
ncbi:MAG: hypothetical protein JWO86_7448 [Myxococcaceae bacterium]|nr:hypothetical protein [Myxococcaceae bacterium]